MGKGGTEMKCSRCARQAKWVCLNNIFGKSYYCTYHKNIVGENGLPLIFEELSKPSTGESDSTSQSTNGGKE